jgi:sigma-E factor negative regulatory protein RseC
MEAIARVLAVGNGRARLACQVQSPCSSCGSGRGCGLRLLAQGREPEIEVPDRSSVDVLLVPGQIVTIAVRDSDVLRAAALAYVPVLGGLLSGAVLGHLLGGQGDGPVALGAVLGAACAWAMARARAVHRRPHVSVLPVAGDPAP